jgi:hypothetical protein
MIDMTPDNNPEKPNRDIEAKRSDVPPLPKNLENEVIPKGVVLTKDVMDFLDANAIPVSPKTLPDIVLSANQRERFHQSGIANIRPTEHKGHPAVIFHYFEISEWETVVIVLPGFTKEEAYLIAQAIRSGRVPTILLGELQRYLSEYSYRGFPPFREVGVIDYPARLRDLQDALNKCKEGRINDAKSQASERSKEPTVTAPSRSHDEVQEIRKAYERERLWKVLLGFLLGVLITAVALYCFGFLAAKPDYLKHTGNEIFSH